MLRVGKMADYALVIMCTMASQPTGLIPMEHLAQSTRLSLPTVRKLMRLLVNAGLVKSVRGIKGGYQLARMPEMIRVNQILAAVDGPVAMTDCCSEDTSCELSGGCDMEAHWSIINQLVGQLLSVISLADLRADSVGSRVDLLSLLQRVAQNPQVRDGVGLCEGNRP